MNDFLESTFGFMLGDPWMLLLAAALPCVWFWLRWVGKPAAGVAHGELLLGIPKSWRVRTSGLPLLLHSLAILGAVAALARPIVRERVPLESAGIDIVLVIDISSSMLATDMDEREPRPPAAGKERFQERDAWGNPQQGAWTRIMAVKDAAKQFIDERKSDRIGIVTFAMYPDLRCPLTLDHRAAQQILSEIECVRPRSEDDKTGIGLGLARAAKTLREAKGRSKVVVLLSDGQENVQEGVPPEEAAKLAKDFGVRVYTIGAGRGERTFFGVQPIDFSELEKIAATTEGKFFRAEDKDTLTATYAAIDKLEKAEIREPRYRHEEKFTWALAPAAALLAAALFLRSTIYAEAPG